MIRRLLGILAGVACAATVSAAPVVRTLDNGLVVGVIADPRAPQVHVQVLLPAGTISEGPREHGVAQMVARLLVRGTASRTAADFAASVEDLGGAVAGSGGIEAAQLTGVFAARDLAAALELMADAVMNPVFAETEVARVREEALQTLARSRRLPHLVADEHAWARIHAGSPYGFPALGTLESLASLERGRFVQFHRECYRPDRVIVSIVGAVDVEAALEAARAAFGGWRGRARTTVLPAPRRPSGLAVRIVDLPGAPEAEIRIALSAPPGRAPDAAALGVANDLLGGGPESRLNAGAGGRRLRSLSTLHLLAEGGALVLSTTAATDSVPGAIARLRGALRDMVAQPPSPAEIDAAVRRLAAAQTIAGEPPGTLAGQWANGRLLGLADDEAVQPALRLRGVDAEAVRGAAARWFDPDHAEIVVVGDAARLRGGLETLGSLEVLPFSAPAMPLAPLPAFDTSEPSDEARLRGRRLADLCVEAHGGVTALRRVRDVIVESDLTLQAGEQSMVARQRELRREPRLLRIETTAGEVSTVQVLNGRTGWARVSTRADSILEEDSLTVQSLGHVFRGDLIRMLLAAAAGDSRLAWRGEEPFGTGVADVVEMVTAAGDRSVLFVGRQDRRLIAVEENYGSALAGPTLRRLFGDFRVIQSLVWPYREERLLQGERTMVLATTRVQINSGLGVEAFEKPGTGAARPRRR